MGTEQENEEILEQDGQDVAQEAAAETTASADALLAAAQAETAEYRDKMLRAAAEFENYKKRMERDRSTALKYAGEPFLREFLPVVDNLERALAQGGTTGVDAEKNLAALLEGVQLTLKSLLSALEKFEVKPVVSVGQPFDPNVQEALAMEASETIPASHVLSEFEKGYCYKDRLLRVARVVVSSGKAA